MDESTEPRARKPSATPSWIMLGFVLGALFVVALPPRRAPAPPPPAPKAAPAPARPPTPPQLSTIEAVFREWGDGAVWHDDLTEVALWDRDTQSFSDFYEVLRSGGVTYFRTIPALTEPVKAHGVKPECPLEFTETEEQRADWLRSRGEEEWRAIQSSVR